MEGSSWGIWILFLMLKPTHSLGGAVRASCCACEARAKADARWSRFFDLAGDVTRLVG